MNLLLAAPTLLTHNSNISNTAMWVMFAISLVLLAGGILSIFFYLKYKRSHRANKNQFQTYTTKTRIYDFWINIVFIFLAFVCFVGFVVLIALFFTAAV